MLQKSAVEIVMTPEEAEQYHRAIHRALFVLGQLPPETDGAFERAQLRAELMRLAALLDDAVVPPVPPPRSRPRGGGPDPFTPEGSGSAQDVLLGRLVSVCSLVLGCLSQRAWPAEEQDVLLRAKSALLAGWREYEEAGRG